MTPISMNYMKCIKKKTPRTQFNYIYQVCLFFFSVGQFYFALY
jgi:hypothetical protein